MREEVRMLYWTRDLEKHLWKIYEAGKLKSQSLLAEKEFRENDPDPDPEFHEHQIPSKSSFHLRVLIADCVMRSIFFPFHKDFMRLGSQCNRAKAIKGGDFKQFKTADLTLADLNCPVIDPLTHWSIQFGIELKYFAE